MSKFENVIKDYMYDMELVSARYQIMTRLLDEQLVYDMILSLNTKEAYVYGGGYLGIQLFHAIKDLIQVPAIVDKGGKLVTNVPSIKVILPDELRNIYNNQKIIITPLKSYKEIYDELSLFASKENIIHLEELLGGMV